MTAVEAFNKRRPVATCFLFTFAISQVVVASAAWYASPPVAGAPVISPQEIVH